MITSLMPTDDYFSSFAAWARVRSPSPEKSQRLGRADYPLAGSSRATTAGPCFRGHVSHAPVVYGYTPN
jgi:hypothetical protein